MSETFEIIIPDALKPRDGRFGSGPSKVREAQVSALSREATGFLGTSHRQSAVRAKVGEVREGLSAFFSLPDGYEVLLGNGGTTAFWDAATFQIIDQQSQHLSFGEFSAKFVAAVEAAPHLKSPQVITSEPGTHPAASADGDVDTYALTHNETSTGVAMMITRPSGAEGIVLVDATSAAGGMAVTPSEFDCYYFAPQKSFGSDGGLWLALCSPAAVERIERIASSGRWTPAFFDLKVALDNSRLNQTYNTPGLSTLHLLASQISWFNENGGLDFATGRSARSAEILYAWAEASEFAAPFVTNPAQRSKVVGTIDLDPAIDYNEVCRVLRANGILDTDPYRKLGRNQLRIAMFPSIDSEDVAALCACINYVVGAILA
jgi:phosphoserine aminotransferase